MNSNVKPALRLFRICMAAFIILSFMAFSEGDEVVCSIGVLLTTMVAISFIGVELCHHIEKSEK